MRLGGATPHPGPFFNVNFRNLNFSVNLHDFNDVILLILKSSLVSAFNLQRFDKVVDSYKKYFSLAGRVWSDLLG